jgi:hypothetical protein
VPVQPPRPALRFVRWIISGRRTCPTKPVPTTDKGLQAGEVGSGASSEGARRTGVTGLSARSKVDNSEADTHTSDLNSIRRFLSFIHGFEKTQYLPSARETARGMVTKPS